MLVYRVCSSEELNKLFNKEEVGRPFIIDSSYNTHQYEENINYMHFFYDKKNTIYISSKRGDLLVTYDIPDDYSEYEGEGLYWEQMNYSFLVNIPELAIPSSLITYDYVVKVEKILDSICFEDFIYEGLDSFLEESDVKKLVKKKH